jgi:hypothetical protein
MTTSELKTICAAIFLVWFLAPTTSAHAADAVTLHLSYTEVHDRILPFVERTSTGVNLTVQLQSNGAVEHDEARVSRAAHGAGSLKLKLGGQQRESWHVSGPDQLVNVTDYYSYKRAIQVTVSGNSCTAKVGYDLKPGQHDYQYNRLTNGERATARSVTATGVSCSIQ